MIRGYVSAFFTRKSGFEVISNNTGINEKELAPLFLSFIPQGRSPEYSEILKNHGLGLFASYFSMINDRDFFLVIFQISSLDEFSHLPGKIFDPHVHDLAVKLARREHSYTEVVQKWPSAENDFSPSTYLSREHWPAMIFSLLAGDDIVIVSGNQKRRQDFFEMISHLLPMAFLRYNSFTLLANELKNNLNIIGVSKRPSEKEVRKQLGLDSIIVDLDENTLDGEGVKTTDVCEELADKLLSSFNEYKSLLQEHAKEWSALGYSPEGIFDPRDQVLIRRIGARIHGKPEEQPGAGFFDL